MPTDRRRPWLWSGIAGLALFASAGCPGRLQDKERFLVDAGSGNCGDVVANIFVPKCGSGVCHGPTSPQQDLDLVSPDIGARVVGVAAKGCTGTLADPGDPRASVLYTKLGPNPPCGSQMPLARLPLSDEEAACILAWIAAQ